MNGPELLGTVFSLLGLYCYIRQPRNAGWLCISAFAFTISVFTKHNLIAFPSALAVQLVWERKWRPLAVWCGVVVAGSAAVLAATYWIDGPYFIANLLVRRAKSASLWFAHFTDFATLFQIPIVFAAVWSLRNRVRSLRHIVVLALIMAHLFAAAFAGGDGIDRNIVFRFPL